MATDDSVTPLFLGLVILWPLLTIVHSLVTAAALCGGWRVDVGEEVSDLLPILPKRRSALFGDPVHGSGPVCDEHLLDGHVATGLQAGHMCVDIAVGESGLLGEVYEVGFIDDVQVRHDDQPGRFVDETVNLDLRLLWVGGRSVHGASMRR